MYLPSKSSNKAIAFLEKIALKSPLTKVAGIFYIKRDPRVSIGNCECDYEVRHPYKKLHQCT